MRNMTVDAATVERRVRREAVQAQDVLLEVVRDLTFTLERGTLTELRRLLMFERLEQVKRMVGEIPYASGRGGESS